MPKYQIHFAWHRHPEKSPDTIVVKKFIDVVTAVRRNLPYFIQVDKVVRLDDTGKETVLYSEGKWKVEELTEHEKSIIKKYLTNLGWKLNSLPQLT
jgi:hypothetical protein